MWEPPSKKCPVCIVASTEIDGATHLCSNSHLHLIGSEIPSHNFQSSELCIQGVGGWARQIFEVEKRPSTNHPAFQQGRVPLRLRFTKLRQKAYPTVRKMWRPPSKKCPSCIVVASMEIDDIFKENLIQKTNPKMFPQDIVCTAGNGESGPLFPINWGSWEPIATLQKRFTFVTLVGMALAGMASFYGNRECFERLPLRSQSLEASTNQVIEHHPALTQTSKPRHVKPGERSHLMVPQGRGGSKSV